MKKLLFILPILLIIVLSGCERQQEFFNDKDKNDFNYAATIQFKVLQIKDVVKSDRIKESETSGSLGWFIFMGGGNYNSSSKEYTMETKNYYAWLENQRGGIYFAKIPVEKCRIYQDAPDGNMFIVGNYGHGSDYWYIPTNEENHWNEYNFFNIHVPEGTIIKNLDDVDFNIEAYISEASTK